MTNETPPVWLYDLTIPQKRSHRSVPAMLREFHRASLLGISVESLSRNGKSIDAVTLILLNEWIRANGAWNASKQDYFESWRRLETIIGTHYRL